MKLSLELIDGTTYTFTAGTGIQTFKGAIARAVEDGGFFNDKEFFPMGNVKRATPHS